MAEEKTDAQRIEEKRVAAADPQSDDGMIAALLREREGYRSQGKDDRVDQVTAELERRGHTDKPSKEKAPANPKTSTSTQQTR